MIRFRSGSLGQGFTGGGGFYQWREKPAALTSRGRDNAEVNESRSVPRSDKRAALSLVNKDPPAKNSNGYQCCLKSEGKNNATRASQFVFVIDLLRIIGETSATLRETMDSSLRTMRNSGLIDCPAKFGNACMPMVSPFSY